MPKHVCWSELIQWGIWDTDFFFLCFTLSSAEHLTVALSLMREKEISAPPPTPSTVSGSLWLTSLTLPPTLLLSFCQHISCLSSLLSLHSSPSLVSITILQISLSLMSHSRLSLFLPCQISPFTPQPTFSLLRTFLIVGLNWVLLLFC